VDAHSPRADPSSKAAADAPVAAADPPVAPPVRPPEPVQRWRLTVRRRIDAPVLNQRDWIAAFEQALLASGLPVALGEGTAGNGARPRLSIGAPLTQGMPSEGELLEVFLTRRCPVWAVREALAQAIPAGHGLLALEDVWLGEPALPGRVVAAEYRAVVAGIDAERLSAAIETLLAASALPRERLKGDRRVAYDLRPFVDTLAAVRSADGSTEVRMRLRHDAEKGIGRPEEVLLELGERADCSLAGAPIVRLGLVLADPKGVERPVVAPRGPRRPSR
jgi:radical SAM-linked protein